MSITLEQVQAKIAEKKAQRSPQNVTLTDVQQAIAGKKNGLGAEEPTPKQLTTSETIEGAGQSLLQGATLGFADEIQSIIAAVVANPFISDKTFSELMVDARKSLREDQSQFREQNPKTALGLEIAGGLATGGAGVIKGAGSVAKQTLPKTIGKGVLSGAGVGGVSGAGFADAEEFISPETLESAQTGAAIGGVAGGVLSGVVGKFKQGSLLKKDIARRIESGETDDDLAKYIVDGAGKVKTDKAAQEAIKQGFDDGVIVAVKGSTPTDKSKMLRMVNVLEKGKKNKSFATRNRASDIAGDSLLSRFRHILAVNKQAGNEIDTIASGLKGQPVDLNKPITAFADKLDDFGVRLVKGADGIKPMFDDAILSPGDRGPIKEVIRQMNRISRTGSPDAFQAHQLKRIIDNNVTFGKNKTGLGGDAERALKELRHGIDEVLDNSFDAYNKANTKYADTISALDSLQSVAGRKMELTGPNADKAVGTLLRRLMSNAQSRVNLMDSVDLIDDTAKKYGGVFDDNINVQMLFADELDRLFKPVARTSFAGEIGKEVERAAGQSINQSAVGKAAELAGKAVEGIRGINEQNAIKSVKELLK